MPKITLTAAENRAGLDLRTLLPFTPPRRSAAQQRALAKRRAMCLIMTRVNLDPQALIAHLKRHHIKPATTRAAILTLLDQGKLRLVDNDG